MEENSRTDRGFDNVDSITTGNGAAPAESGCPAATDGNDAGATTMPQQKEKSKKLFSGGIKYLSELSVVIVGIAITFMVSGWIGDLKEKKALDRQVQAVRTELSENLKPLEDAYDYFEKAAELAQYLMSKTLKELNEDIIDNIAISDGIGRDIPIPNYSSKFSYFDSAYQLLKSSGNIHLISDQKSSLGILECYEGLAELKTEIDDYMNRKLDVLYSDMVKIPEDQTISGISLLNPVFYSTKNFLSMHYDLEIRIDKLITKIKNVIEQLS